MPEPIVQVTEYTVRCLPEDHPSSRHFSLKVAYRGAQRWAVTDTGYCLSRSGTWQYEQVPSERCDEWLAEHRFDLATALDLARDQAPHLEVNGRTVAEVLARG